MPADDDREKLIEEMSMAYDRKRKLDPNCIQSSFGWAVDSYMAAAFTVAEDRIRADEREACADVAEEAVGDDGLLYNDGPMIAAAIRAPSA